MKLCGRLKQMTEAQVHRTLRCGLGHLDQINNPQKYSLTIWISESCWGLQKGFTSKGT